METFHSLGGKKVGQGNYVGEWNQEEDMHGEGTMKYPDGSVQYGMWKKGFVYGYSIFTWPDGDRWEGERRDNKPHGKMTIYK